MKISWKRWCILRKISLHLYNLFQPIVQRLAKTTPPQCPDSQEGLWICIFLWFDTCGCLEVRTRLVAIFSFLLFPSLIFHTEMKYLCTIRLFVAQTGNKIYQIHFFQCKFSICFTYTFLFETIILCLCIPASILD